MATWPVTLPQEFLSSSFKDTEPKLSVQFQTDVGPPLTRRRATAGIREFSGDMIITGTQKATLRTFYRTYCASEIDFPDPDTGSTITVVFMGEPEYASAGGCYQKVSLKFGELPS